MYTRWMQRIGLISWVVLAMILTSCDDPQQTAPPSGITQSARVDGTSKLCDKVVELKPTLDKPDTMKSIVDAANIPGIDQRVHSAIIDGLYVNETLPTEGFIPKYEGVLSACRRTGWTPK